MNRRGASKLLPSRDTLALGERYNEVVKGRSRIVEDARVEEVYRAWVDEQAATGHEDAQGSVVDRLLDGAESAQLAFYAEGSSAKGTLTPGYITKDACKGKGDDILHSPRKLSSLNSKSQMRS